MFHYWFPKDYLLGKERKKNQKFVSKKYCCVIVRKLNFDIIVKYQYQKNNPVGFFFLILLKTIEIDVKIPKNKDK